MAAIIYDRFGGIIPKIDPRNLPDTASQRAHNVELSSGRLAPIDMTGGFQVMHDPDTGKMVPQVPEGELIKVGESIQPVLAEKIRICHPDEWGITIYGNVFVEYYDTDGTYNTTSVGFNSFGSSTIEYTEDGFLLKSYLGVADTTLKAGVYYKVYGPKFGFTIPLDDGYRGGPDQAYSFPNPVTLYHTSPDVPFISMPLTAPEDYSDWDGDPTKVYTGDRFTYGKLQLTDISAPVAITEWDGTQVTANTLVKLTESGMLTFYFKCNYNQPATTYYKYATQGVDYRVASGKLTTSYSGSLSTIAADNMKLLSGVDVPGSGTLVLKNAADQWDHVSYSGFGLAGGIYTFSGLAIVGGGGSLTYSYLEDDDLYVQDADSPGRAGPVSDESERISVDPGEIVKLTVPLPTACIKQTLFRSTTSDYHELTDELDEGVFYDNFTRALSSALSVNGNYPHTDYASASDGSIFLGGRIAVLIYGNALRPSEPDKPWMFPEEYTFPVYAPILAAVGFLSSAIVFTDTNDAGEVGKVYRIGGQHPAYWTRQLLSSCKPLLSVRSIGIIDQTAFYVSSDGVIAVSAGGQVQNITEQFFNREQWEVYEPEFYSMYTRDSSLFLIHTGTNGVHFRIDLNDGHAYLTTFDGFNSGEIDWLGRRERSNRPISFKVAQVDANSYPVELRMIGDEGQLEYQILLPNGDAKMLPRLRKSKTWEIGVKSLEQVNRIAVATNVQELNNG